MSSNRLAASVKSGTTPSLRRLWGAARYLVDEQVGPLHSLGEVRVEAGHPNFFHFTAQLCDTTALRGREAFGVTFGASANRRVAASRAVADAVALYCAACQDREALPLTSWDEAGFRRARPEEFALYSDEQYNQPDFPFAPLRNYTPVRWAPCVDPLNGEECWVPAALVLLPYEAGAESGEVPIAPQNSIGLACGASPAEAALAAVCDVIECDALALAWQARIPVPQIRIETLSDFNYELVARFERAAGAVSLLDLTLDLGVPTVLAVARSKVSTAPAFVCAAAADPDPEYAVLGSLENLALALWRGQQIKSHAPRLEPEPYYANVIDQIDHLNFWCDHANARLADFLFSSPERVEADEMAGSAAGDPREDLRVLLERARDAGHRVLLADLTTPDVRDLGLTVVRAVVPGLHPLFIGHGLRALGGPRLSGVAAERGGRVNDRGADDNPPPHPYARMGAQ